MVILAALPGIVRELLVNGKLVKPGNFSVIVNLSGARIRKVGVVSRNLPGRSSSRTLISRRVLKRFYGASGRLSFSEVDCTLGQKWSAPGQKWIALGIIESRYALL